MEIQSQILENIKFVKIRSGWKLSFIFIVSLKEENYKNILYDIYIFVVTTEKEQLILKKIEVAARQESYVFMKTFRNENISDDYFFPSCSCLEILKIMLHIQYIESFKALTSCKV